MRAPMLLLAVLFLTATALGKGMAFAAPADPPVGIDAQPQPGEPQTFAFAFNASGNGSAQFAWDFGDGAGSFEAAPTHTFAGPGEYTVRLVVTDAQGQQSETWIVVAVPSPPGGPDSSGPAITPVGLALLLLVVAVALGIAVSRAALFGDDDGEVDTSAGNRGAATQLASAMARFDAGTRFDILGLNELEWGSLRDEAAALDSPVARAKAFAWARAIADRLEREGRPEAAGSFLRAKLAEWQGPDGAHVWADDRARLPGLLADTRVPGGALTPSLMRRVGGVEESLIDHEVKRLNRMFAAALTLVFAAALSAMVLLPGPSVCGNSAFLGIAPTVALAIIGLTARMPKISDYLVPHSSRTLWHEPAVRLLVGLFLVSFLSFAWAAFGLISRLVAPQCAFDPQLAAILGSAAAAGGLSSKAMFRWQAYRTTRSQRTLLFATSTLLAAAFARGFTASGANPTLEFGPLAVETSAAGQIGSILAGAVAFAMLGLLWASARRSEGARRVAQALLDDLAEYRTLAGLPPEVALPHLESASDEGVAVRRQLRRLFGPGYGKSGSRSLYAVAQLEKGSLAVEARRRSFRLKRGAPSAGLASAGPSAPSSPWRAAGQAPADWAAVLLRLRAQAGRLEPPPREFRKLPQYGSLRELILGDASARADFLRVAWRGKPVGLVLLARLLRDRELRPEQETDADYLDMELDLVAGIEGVASVRSGDRTWDIDGRGRLVRKVIERGGVSYRTEFAPQP